VEQVSSGGFPATRFSIVGRMSAADPDVRARALDAFATAYWVPVSRYIRFKWHLDADHAADLTQEQLVYAASDVLHLHALRRKLDVMLQREGRTEIAAACYRFLPTRARLDLEGWPDLDIFSH